MDRFLELALDVDSKRAELNLKFDIEEPKAAAATRSTGKRRNTRKRVQAKPKSAEFVVDSDEESDIYGASPSRPLVRSPTLPVPTDLALATPTPVEPLYPPEPPTPAPSNVNMPDIDDNHPEPVPANPALAVPTPTEPLVPTEPPAATPPDVNIPDIMDDKAEPAPIRQVYSHWTPLRRPA